jgi:hypothetical protein
MPSNRYVWIVEKGRDHDGSKILGIFESAKSAKLECDEAMDGEGWTVHTNTPTHKEWSKGSCQFVRRTKRAIRK